MTPPTAPTIASKLTTDDSRHDFDRCGPETGPNGERRNPGTCLYPEPAARPLRTRDGCTPRTDPCRGVRRACAGGLKDQPHRGRPARDRRSINATEPWWVVLVDGSNFRGQGCWILNAYSGKIYTSGDAVPYGQPADTSAYCGGADTWPTAVDIVATPDSEGYWVLEEGLRGLGSVQAFGDAVSYGDESTIDHGVPHVGVPVAIALTPDGKGYW